ncbi:MAG: PIG-L family deacetylase [Candidatus Omnitrophota bacterium]
MLVFLFVFSPCFLYAQSLFTKHDRVLILAPHPDDEIIGTGGVIQQALKAHAKLKVACFTNGDNNELAFIVYEKRITFKKDEFLHMGQTRARETIKALEFMGLRAEDIVFLGYPDFGTLEILTTHWQDTGPFKSMFARVSEISYPDALSFRAAFVGENILKDLEKIILEFKPNKIFLSHPGDTNRDHQALYLFTRIALWNLEGRLKSPKLYPYLIHVVKWPMPRGHHLDLELDPPDKFKPFKWSKVFLSEAEVSLKHKAINFFTSQIEYNPPYLFTFARKNELFGDYPPVWLKKNRGKVIFWTRLDADSDIEDGSDIAGEEGGNLIFGLAYRYDDHNLYVKMHLKNRMSLVKGISIFLLGYSKSESFARMPKIKISLGLFAKSIKDKKRPIFMRGFKISYQGSDLILNIPLAGLGYPDYILTRVRTGIKSFTFYTNSWRIIELQ